ncbi:Caspase-9 [Halotydeus destructor]|nr:Caspase-9 [Halotydeus destructor]
MELQDRIAIHDNMATLLRIPVNDILPILQFKNVFNLSMADDIWSYNVEEQPLVMIRELSRRGPEAFAKFVDTLVETGHEEVALTLKPNVELFPSQNSSNDSREVPNPSSRKMIVRASSSVHEGRGHYKTNMNRPRGNCVIINNVDFQDELYTTRHGSVEDAKKLRDVFEGLGYRVHYHLNLTASEMMTHLKIAAKDEAIAKERHDSLVVIILTHGSGDVHVDSLVGVDNQEIFFHSQILEMFNNKNCPRLQGKPKMFFIQACRGDKGDEGINMGLEGSYDAIGFSNGNGDPSFARKELKRIPYKKDSTYSDIMVSFSTVRGYLSYRNPASGSWYCTALLAVLAREAHDTELSDMLKHVDKKVQENVSEGGFKQTTSFENIGFNKHFYFNHVMQTYKKSSRSQQRPFHTR